MVCIIFLRYLHQDIPVYLFNKNVMRWTFNNSRAFICIPAHGPSKIIEPMQCIISNAFALFSLFV